MDSSDASVSPAGEAGHTAVVGGAGNQRFQSARGTRGNGETGNQGTLSYGYGREHGGTGNYRAGGEICRREERWGATDEHGQEKAAD